MNKLQKCGTALSLAMLCFSSLAEEKKPEVRFATAEVAPGIYMISGVGGFTGGNIGYIIHNNANVIDLASGRGQRKNRDVLKHKFRGSANWAVVAKFKDIWALLPDGKGARMQLKH